MSSTQDIVARLKQRALKDKESTETKDELKIYQNLKMG